MPKAFAIACRASGMSIAVIAGIVSDLIEAVNAATAAGLRRRPGSPGPARCGKNRCEDRRACFSWLRPLSSSNSPAPMAGSELGPHRLDPDESGGAEGPAFRRSLFPRPAGATFSFDHKHRRRSRWVFARRGSPGGTLKQAPCGKADLAAGNQTARRGRCAAMLESRGACGSPVVGWAARRNFSEHVFCGQRDKRSTRMGN